MGMNKQIMYYHITLWKTIDDNKDVKKDTSTIFNFLEKTDFGILKLNVEPEANQPQQVRQYTQEELDQIEQQQAQAQADAEAVTP